MLSLTVDCKDRRRSSPLCDRFDQKNTPEEGNPNNIVNIGTFFIFVGKMV